MKYDLALGRKIDLDGIDRDAQLGKCPRHVVRTLRDRLNATVHAPDGEAISSSDKLRSKISSKPEHWAAARKLSEQVSSDDLKISGFSKDAKALSQAFPDTLPENMSRKLYEWPDLVQLYRDADVIAVCLMDNKYAAGGTALLEAMACKWPVVITRTQGMVDYLAAPDIAKVINVPDAAGLREAIVHLLKNAQEAASQAQRGLRNGCEPAQQRMLCRCFSREVAIAFIIM